MDEMYLDVIWFNIYAFQRLPSIFTQWNFVLQKQIYDEVLAKLD
jgi:hypothetical protein